MIGAHVLVTEVGPFHGTVVEAEGVDTETGELVRFAGDHRPMGEIAIALQLEEDPVAIVPDWAELSRRPQ